MSPSAQLRSCSGQATVEYVGSVLLVAALLSGLAATAGAVRPAADLLGAISERMLCAVRLAVDCRPPAGALQRAFGTEVAALLAAHAPELRFEEGEFASLPVDPRACRERRCADSSRPGALTRSFEGRPATAFVHAVDCRGPRPVEGTDCAAGRSGNLYLHYWLYYPDSATKPFGRHGYHRDDWESLQLRIGPGGEAEARASSHKGYNHDADPLSDAFGGAGAWGPAEGYLWISSGSHAGRVSGGDPYLRSVPAPRLRLLPLEAELDSLAALEFEVTPPWLKEVWRDPESTAT